MIECNTLLSSVLAGERSRWTCREVSSDTVLVVTSHHYADGDTIELTVRTVGDEVIVSDGGEVLARLDSVGVNVDARSRVGKSWKRLMAAHALEDDHGQLVRRASVKHAADLVQEMADALANLDGLRLLAPAPRRLAFPERLTTYLEAEFPFVEPRAKLTGASGWSYRVTAAAGGSEEQPVYIQTASGHNTAAQKSAVEHCFTMFSDVNGQLPTEQKLVVLDDEAVPEWRPEMINLLSGVTYVGTWTARDRWTEFVWGNAPESRLMLPPEQPNPAHYIPVGDPRMDKSLNRIQIGLVGVSPADASQLASELREYLLAEKADLDVEQARSDPASQDLGATLILLLAAPSVTAVARGLARWFARRGQSSIDFHKGKTSLRMTNLSNKTAAQISQELLDFLKDEKVEE